MKEGKSSVLTAVYFAAVLLPVLLLILTGQITGTIPFHIAARFLAVTGFAMMVLQPVLSARFRWMERPVGLDRLIAFHRVTGAAAALLILLHPVMLAAGYGSISILTDTHSPWQITAGRITLVILVIYGAAALYRSALKIPFQQWFRIHGAATPLLLAGAFLHSWFTAVRYMPGPIRVYWWILIGAGSFAWLHLNLYQRLRARCKPFTVSRVTKVTDNVWEIGLTPPAGTKVFHYLPGQFMFITLLRGRGLPVEEHPFTISSSPSGGELSISVKESGDFTSGVGRTIAGDKAAVLAPYGRFSYLLHPERKQLVLIAGGIGVTPFLSMIRYMRDTGVKREAVLFYCNRTQRDIAHREELDNAAGDSIRVIHVLSRPEDVWQGERGRISGEIIKRHLAGLENTGFYICGPPPMMDSAREELLSLGVDPSEIHMERFSL